MDAIAGTTTRYYYDDQRVAVQTAVVGAAETDDRYFVFGNYIDEVLVMHADAADLYYAHDHLYSPVALFAANGTVAERYEYDAYGKVQVLSSEFLVLSSSQYGNPYAFTGRERDSLDAGSRTLMYYRARTHDPETGRFMQRDPLGIDPAGWHTNPFYAQKQYEDGTCLYEYVRSNVINRNDYMGLSSRDCSSNILVTKKAPKKWSTKDFVHHYCFGKDPFSKGESVDLDAIGLLDDFKNSPSVQLHTLTYFWDVFTAVIDVVNSFQCTSTYGKRFFISGSDTVVTDVKLDPGLFSIGRSTFYRSYWCTIYVKCCGSQKCFNYLCKMNYSIRDKFADPLDIGIELPGCTPYGITAKWSNSKDGGNCDTGKPKM